MVKQFKAEERLRVMLEEWKDIEGYEGLYMVSSLGRVKSLNYHRTSKERIMKLCKENHGYLHVMLCKNHKQKTLKVHRLVATAFIPNPDNKPCIDHINTVKDDNRVENLMWCTAKENVNNPISIKRLLENSPTAGKFGKDHFRSKPVYQYSLDGKLIRKWGSTMDVQRELGILQQNISRCCLGKRKTAYGFIWQYAE